jgi:glycerol uptake facilitator protein
VPGDYGNVNSYMWIPIVAPIVGGLVGAFIYDFFIGSVLRSRRAAEEATPAGYAGPGPESEE